MKTHDQKFDKDIHVIGGVDVPDDLFVSTDGDDVPQDDLGQQLYWLQKLNPGVLKFRLQDVSKMDDATKQLMIDDFQYALGVAPLADCIR